MIKLEQKMLPELQPYTQERAEKLIDLLQSKDHHCPQPLQYRTGFRPEKSAEFAGGAGATSGGLRV